MSEQRIVGKIIHDRTTSISSKLAHFIYMIKYDSLEDKVVNQVKKCFLDYIGVSLAGSTTDVGRALINLIKSMGGAKEATIIGGHGKYPCVNAAFVNGALAHIHDLDDGHRLGWGHPGAPVISAALAACEKVNAPGKELITAIVAGYEVFVRISRSINPSHLKRGFHPTGTCGVFGAAAAAGKILGLSEDELANALGIAGTQASGLLEVLRGGSVIKFLNPARAAQSGLLAALLAQQGMSAPDTILEGEHGFCRATSDNFNLETITAGLGEEFAILGVYFKFYPSCRHTHPSIDAVLQLMKEYGRMSPEEIDRIVVQTYSEAYALCGKEYEPKTFSTAKFSLPYCIAAAIVEGKVDLDTFTDTKIKDRRILDLAKKVKVEVDPYISKLVPEKRGSRVIIFKKNGEKLEHYVDMPYGEPENPATLESLKEKFMAIACKAITTQKVIKLIDLIDKLEMLKSIKEITDNL